MDKELQFNFRFDLNAYSMAFEYLEELRESGMTNMFGARPYLMDEMCMDESESKQAAELLTNWMKSFDLGENWEDRALAVHSQQEVVWS